MKQFGLFSVVIEITKYDPVVIQKPGETQYVFKWKLCLFASIILLQLRFFLYVLLHPIWNHRSKHSVVMKMAFYQFPWRGWLAVNGN